MTAFWLCCKARARSRRENECAYPSPRKWGRGTARSSRSERRVVEGVSESELHCRRRMIVAARAPSTTLLRRVVRLPRNGVPAALARRGAPRGAG